MDFNYLTHIAIKAAKSAGTVIQKYMNEDVDVENKKGGSNYASQVVTKVDKEAEDVILAHLRPTCTDYDLALLTEETDDDGSRFDKKYFWCIDPIDGTLNFINKEPGFSVSIALIAQDGTPYIGVIYDPISDTVYHVTKGYGTFKNGVPWVINNKNTFLTYVTDKTLNNTPRFSELEQLLLDKVQELELNGFVEMAGGASVMNGIRVLEHGPACMIKFPKKEIGGGSIWDFASTACFFQELGLNATNFNGAKLDLNKKNGTFMNHEGIFFSNFKK